MIRTRLAVSVLLPLLMLAMTAGSALAQSELRPPTIRESPASPRIWMYVVFVLLLAVVIFAASLKPKRTHQD